VVKTISDYGSCGHELPPFLCLSFSLFLALPVS
jgi:hypothetical protein